MFVMFMHRDPKMGEIKIQARRSDLRPATGDLGDDFDEPMNPENDQSQSFDQDPSWNARNSFRK